MVLFYVMKIKDGTITIEDVPKRWKEAVQKDDRSIMELNGMEIRAGP